MATEALQGGPYPVAGGADNVPADMQAVVVWAAPRLNMTFASAAARTSAFTAAGISAAAGMLCYRADAPGLNKYEYYSAAASAWRVHGAYQDATQLAANAATVTFSAIPTYLRTIRLTIRARTTNAGAFGSLTLTVGGDAGANYNTAKIYVQNGSSLNGVIAANTATAADIGYAPGAAAIGGRFGLTEVTIGDWTAPTAQSLAIRHSGGYTDYTGNYLDSRGESLYIGTAALTSITVAGSTALLAGTTIDLQAWE